VLKKNLPQSFDSRYFFSTQRHGVEEVHRGFFDLPGGFFMEKQLSTSGVKKGK
jgi:hypothetical protein